MICDTISSWKAMKAALPPAFEMALAWIERNKDEPPADATLPLENGARVIVQSYEPRGIDGERFENHHRYADVQYVVAGSEMIFWAKSGRLAITTPYSVEKDIEFGEIVDPVTNSTSLLLEAGTFAILWPGDWHMPCIDPMAVHSPAAEKGGKVKKFVVKIPV